MNLFIFFYEEIAAIEANETVAFIQNTCSTG